MRVIIEESAVADIDGLAAWVAKESPQAARSVVEKILETIERLNLFPEMGHKGKDEGTCERGVSGTPYIYSVRIAQEAGRGSRDRRCARRARAVTLNIRKELAPCFSAMETVIEIHPL
jgi:plasmid stabilization system protein ParE